MTKILLLSIRFGGFFFYISIYSLRWACHVTLRETCSHATAHFYLIRGWSSMETTPIGHPWIWSFCYHVILYITAISPHQLWHCDNKATTLPCLRHRDQAWETHTTSTSVCSLATHVEKVWTRINIFAVHMYIWRIHNSKPVKYIFVLWRNSHSYLFYFRQHEYGASDNTTVPSNARHHCTPSPTRTKYYTHYKSIS